MMKVIGIVISGKNMGEKIELPQEGDKKENEVKLENSIEKGRNVTVHAVFIRHGEKEHDPDNPETGLTLKGEWNSRVFGQRRGRKDSIKPISSDTNRTKDTAKYAVVQSPAKNKENLELDRNLAFEYDPDSDFMKEIIRIKNDILGDDYENLSDEEFSKRLHEASIKQADYYLSFGNEKPDSIVLSPVEVASRIAKMVYDYINKSDDIKNGSSVDFINATHDFNLITFIKEVIVRKIDGEKIRGFSSVEEVGGPFDFNESFEVLIKTDEKGNKETKLLFRDNEFDLDLNRLNELVDINKNLDKKGEK